MLTLPKYFGVYTHTSEDHKCSSLYGHKLLQISWFCFDLGEVLCKYSVRIYSTSFLMNVFTHKRNVSKLDNGPKHTHTLTHSPWPVSRRAVWQSPSQPSHPHSPPSTHPPPLADAAREAPPSGPASDSPTPPALASSPLSPSPSS